LDLFGVTSSTGVSVSVGSGPKTIGASWLKKQAKCWSYGGYISWFPEMGVPHFIIHFRLGFSVNKPSSYWWFQRFVYFQSRDDDPN
jgi:hypothetical protein